MLHLNTLARGPAHHDAALPEQALCSLGFGEHHVAELDLSLAIDKLSVHNKNDRLDNESVIEHLDITWITCLDPNFSWFRSSQAWLFCENEEYIIKSNYIYSTF